MIVNIQINDEEGQEKLIVSNCHQTEWINLQMVGPGNSCTVFIEDLKSAIRKISTK